MRRSKSSSILGKVILFIIVAAFSSGVYIYQTEPDFLLDRFYAVVYPGRQEVEPEIFLNEKPAYFEIIGKEWQTKKNNGEWYTAPANDERIDSAVPTGMQSKPSSIISSTSDKLIVNVDKQPDQVDLKILKTDSGQVVLEGKAELAKLPLPKQNGNFTYELTMRWSPGQNPYQGKYVLAIPVTVKVPAQFIFSTERLEQGQLLEITAYYAGDPEDVIFEQSIYDKFRWFSEDGSLRGYLPTNYNVKPGTYPIKYGVKSQGTEETQLIEILEHKYHIQYLTVNTKTEAETRNDEAYAEYNKYYIPVRNQSEPSRYYTDSFLIPTKGRLTTEFGETRYVNDQPTSYRHLGLDIAAPAGTEVMASNRGKVVLARSFLLTGNTVMIDHGEGLFSVYHHLLNISVKTGDIAERGQKIGEVGSTGFSTGAHLHFMISYYNANLEPGFFLVGQPITYENYKEYLQ
ncbi:M23 family metallopeptidase [Anoxybacterium hadale]|uniref:M23 family metallopeptidase n=1 Tax=Anoxybacterium hadale TaxID=3408580 RepID=UPI003B00E320